VSERDPVVRYIGPLYIVPHRSVLSVIVAQPVLLLLHASKPVKKSVDRSEIFEVFKLLLGGIEIE